MQHSPEVRFVGPTPVFVDHHGGRRRIVGRIGVGVSLLAAAYGAVLVMLTVMGIRVDAPTLPLFDHLPRVASGQPDQARGVPPRSAPEPTTRLVGVTGSEDWGPAQIAAGDPAPADVAAASGPGSWAATTAPRAARKVRVAVIPAARSFAVPVRKDATAAAPRTSGQTTPTSAAATPVAAVNGHRLTPPAPGRSAAASRTSHGSPQASGAPGTGAAGRSHRPTLPAGSNSAAVQSRGTPPQSTKSATPANSPAASGTSGAAGRSGTRAAADSAAARRPTGVTTGQGEAPDAGRQPTHR